ncbi:MAG: Holliday junction resolvase RuvX [bacterium]
MRIMGLDIGERRVGVAISDELGITAQGIEVIVRESDALLFSHLERLMSKYQVEEIIVGLPKEMSGKIGIQANKILNLVETMKLNLSIPIKTWDERLTTKIAKNTLKNAPLKKRKQKATVDKLAAILILQNYLDLKRQTLK